MKTLRIFAAITALVAAWLGAPHSARAADDAGAIPIRIAVNTSGGQGEVPYVISQFQLDKKHGFDVQIVDFSAPGQQFVLVKSDAVDVLPGSFIDLMRQRKAGARIKAFHAFQTYSNRIIVKPDAPFKTFGDLKGKKFGHYGTTVLDWLIARVAGRQAFGFDVEKDTSLVPGTPPQLNALLTRGEIDGMLQFSSLTIAPILKGDQRVLTDIGSLMRDANFATEALYSHWNIAEKWLAAHPGAVEKLSAMFDEAYIKLKTEDGVWPAIAQKIGMTDPAAVAAYRELERRVDNPPYSSGRLKPTQEMIDAIIALAGDGPVGFTAIDPNAFLFP